MSVELAERFPEDHPGFRLEGYLPEAVVNADTDTLLQAAEPSAADLPNSTNLRSEIHVWRGVVEQLDPKERPKTVEGALRLCI